MSTGIRWGLRHAISLAYTGKPLSTFDDPGVATEYGDEFDIMGRGLGHFSAPHQDTLLWLDPEAVRTVTESGTFLVRPIESALGQNPKALKIRRPGSTRDLWIEFRQPIGFDTDLLQFSPTAYQGALVHYQPPPGMSAGGVAYNSLNSGLLDFHHTTYNNFTDAPFLPGESWTDPNATLTITIGAASSAGINVTVTLNQTCSYALSPGSNANAGIGGGTGSITITTDNGCPWTASSDSAWLTITSSASGSGPGSVQYSAAANPGGGRIAVVTIAGKFYTITQAGTSTCSFSLNPGNRSFGPAGGTATIGVGAAAGCGWTAVSNVEWISITGAGSGSGNGQVAYSVAATNANRSGAMTIGGQTFTVNQSNDAGNDEPASATVISSLPFTFSQNTTTATGNPADPLHSCTSDTDSNTIWFRYLATFTGPLTAGDLEQ